MPEPRTGRGATALVKKITQFRSDNSGERNLYPFVRDLLVNPAFGIGLKSDQVVVDSALAGGRDIPDLTVFSTKGGRAIIAMRLPAKESTDQTLKPVDSSKAWLAPLMGDSAQPEAEYKGDPTDAVWLPNEAVARAWTDGIRQDRLNQRRHSAAADQRASILDAVRNRDYVERR